MKQEKDLLLKDLCSRLPYGVKLETLEGPQELDMKWLSINMCNIASPYLPYLIPLSSMTEWQERELEILMKNSIESCGMLSPYDCLEMERFFNENHIDWRGLIPKGLAVDATELNIY